jgi:hypothetical protein
VYEILAISDSCRYVIELLGQILGEFAHIVSNCINCLHRLAELLNLLPGLI